MSALLTRRNLIALAGLGSLGLLLAAFYFQYVVGLLPCVMCLWQRWPHRVAIALSVLGVAIPNALIAWAGALSALVGAGLALMHTGVERDWWEGPQVCGASSAEDLGNIAIDDLLNTDQGPQIVPCGEAVWHFLGLSMASWNGIMCLVLAGIWIMAARRAERRA